MKSFSRSLKRQDGFTLVELMVVVAIIGLLSAVAIPNFRKYQAKAKLSEAKLQLSAAYTAQSAFFSDYNIYANCLAYMGYNPAPEANARYYAVGFVAANANPANTTAQWITAVNSGLQDTAGNCVAAAAGGIDGMSMFIANKGVGAVTINTAALFATAAGAAPANCTPALGSQADTANMTYTITATGVIDGNFATAATSSCVTIDQAKTIRVVRNGY